MLVMDFITQHDCISRYILLKKVSEIKILAIFRGVIVEIMQG
jgi:hypothetical protein